MNTVQVCNCIYLFVLIVSLQELICVVLRKPFGNVIGIDHVPVEWPNREQVERIIEGLQPAVLYGSRVF